jgi:ABC-type molybdate transport system substrate-binding protein
MKAKVKTIAIPDDLNVVAEYKIGLLKSAAGQPESRQFYDFVLSADGRAYLEKHGFLPP